MKSTKQENVEMIFQHFSSFVALKKPVSNKISNLSSQLVINPMAMMPGSGRPPPRPTPKPAATSPSPANSSTTTPSTTTSQPATAATTPAEEPKRTS